MSRRPTRSPHSIRSTRRPARVGFRPTPFFWIILGVVVTVILIALGSGWWLVVRQPTPTPLLPTLTPSPTLIPTLTLSPTITPTSTINPVPTDPPRLCVTNQDTDMYTLPAQNAVREPLPSGTEVTVIGETFEDNLQWYRAVVSGFERYIPFNTVNCGGNP